MSAGQALKQTARPSILGRLNQIPPALIVGVVFFGAWELAVRIFKIKEFLLPKPSSIWKEVVSQWSGADGTLSTAPLKAAGWNTGYIAVTGLILGLVFGVALALTVTRFQRVGGALTPFAVAVNATPIIALAPIFNNWFGITGNFSNQAIVMVVVFFPVFINTAKGLTDVHPDQLELMRSYGASDFTILRRVRVPNAIPFFLTSLRLAAPLCVIAAIVAEYFGGPQDRLGPVITQNASFTRYDSAWAAIVVASAIGLSLFGLALLVERYAMPWKRPAEAV